MKKSAFTLLALLAMTSVTFASVSLDIVPDTTTPATGSGLAAYIIQATGVGITTLSSFTIADDVHQVWTLYDPPGPDPAVTIQSEWVGNGTMTPHADDSYVIFGDQRIVGADPDAVTLETLSGTSPCMGTLNNFDDGGTPADDTDDTWDCYLLNNAGALPGASATTVDLIRVVLADTADETALDFEITLFTDTDYDSTTGTSTVSDPIVITEFGAGPVNNPGDANHDDVVDYLDLGILAGNYGQSGKTWEEADFTGEGDVDYLDLGVLAGAYGTTYGAASAAPEPSSIIMLILGALCLVGYRVRK